MKKLYRMVILSATLLCLPLAVSAQSMEDKIRSLEATVEQLQETLLKMRAETAKAEQASASDEGGVVRTDGEDVTLSTTGGGFKLKSDNGNSFQFGGRLMLDYDSYDFDNNKEPAEAKDASEAEWRRTRITAKGTVKKDWDYGLTVNIDDGDSSADINTAYIKYSGFKPISLTVGKFKEPFGLERLTSSKWISTIERGMMYEILESSCTSADYKEKCLASGQPDLGGVMVSGVHPEMGNLNWALGVFDDGVREKDGDDNYGFTGRIAVAPRLSDDSFMHLGLAFSEREIEDGESAAGYKAQTRLGVHTADKYTLGEIKAMDDASQWGLEAAFVTGPFSLQIEYMDLDIDGGNYTENNMTKKSDDLESESYYIQGTWTLTGEHRSYKTKGAYFDKIEPKAAMGAWELVARYEEADAEVAGIENEAEKLVLGVNWYANSNVKFMLNYIDAEVDYGDAARKTDDGDAISFRAQYAF